MHTQPSLFQKARELPQRQVNVAIHAGESHLMRFLIGAILLCVCMYLYFVGLSIMNVIGHREASVESKRLQSMVSALEEDYFSLSKGITPALAPALGLAPAIDSSFVRRTSGMASNVVSPSN